eukprot:5533951-Pleurochrysis_carterae.AAC.1
MRVRTCARAWARARASVSMRANGTSYEVGRWASMTSLYQHCVSFERAPCKYRKCVEWGVAATRRRRFWRNLVQMRD